MAKMTKSQKKVMSYFDECEGVESIEIESRRRFTDRTMTTSGVRVQQAAENLCKKGILLETSRERSFDYSPSAHNPWVVTTVTYKKATS